MKNETRELMEKIKMIICAEEGIHPDTVFVKTRQKEVKEARQIIAYFCRKYIVGEDGKELSFQTIGDYIGGKDHATVMHACKVLDGYISNDRLFRARMEKYDKMIMDYSGMYSLDVALLFANKIRRQMEAVRRDYALLEDITKRLLPVEG
jgi:hypothetical protein